MPSPTTIWRASRRSWATCCCTWCSIRNWARKRARSISATWPTRCATSHPHVYGDIHANTPDQVKENWEALKLRKKNRRSGTLGGVPRSLPAMVKAYRMGEKAAGAGFDWEQKEDVWDKVREELGEVEAEMKSGSKTDLEGEFGDLLFALVNACRLYGVDPESALERTNKKFIQRFNYMEERAAAKGHTLHEMSLGAMEELWQEAKRN